MSNDDEDVIDPKADDLDEDQDDKDSSDDSDDEEITPEQAKQLKKDNQTLKVQRERWKQKAEGKDKPKGDDPKPDAKQSNEPNYGEIAFLKGEGVKHPDDQKYIKDEASRLKLPLTEVLEMEHVKTALKNNTDKRETEAAMPKGKGKAGGSTPQDVEYHLAKGTTPDNDLELAEKVIAAREKQTSEGSKFSDDLYTG